MRTLVQGIRLVCAWLMGDRCGEGFHAGSWVWVCTRTRFHFGRHASDSMRWPTRGYGHIEGK